MNKIDQMIAEEKENASKSPAQQEFGRKPNPHEIPIQHITIKASNENPANLGFFQFRNDPPNHHGFTPPHFAAAPHVTSPARGEGPSDAGPAGLNLGRTASVREKELR